MPDSLKHSNPGGGIVRLPDCAWGSRPEWQKLRRVSSVLPGHLADALPVA